MIKGRNSIRYGIVILILLVSTLFSLCIGSVMIDPIHAIAGLFTQDDFILNEYRIPRTLLGLVIGSSLAISGAVIQGVIRNPLASPDVIGKRGKSCCCYHYYDFSISSSLCFTFRFICRRFNYQFNSIFPNI